MAAKFVCKNEACGWSGLEPVVAGGEYPEALTESCPSCGSSDLLLTCEIEGCEQEAMVGCMHADGVYRWTCGSHTPHRR